MYGAVLGGRGEEISIMPAVCPRGTVSVSSLDYFSSISSSSKHSLPSFPLSIGSRHIQDYFKKKRGGGRKFINPQHEKAMREEQRNKMKVTVRAKFVVGFWELVPME